MGSPQAYPTAPATVRHDLRQEQALKLRVSGMKYRQIAAELGVSLAVAYGYVRDVLSETRASAYDSAIQARQIELDRLDEMQERLAGNAVWSESVINSMLRVSERRARLLGLDAPVKREFSGPGGGPIPLGFQAPTWDLSKLTTDQLLELERLHTLAAAEPVAVIPSPDTEESDHALLPDAAPRGLPAGSLRPQPNGTDPAEAEHDAD